MNIKHFSFAIVLFYLVLSNNVLFAQSSQWIKIAEKTVNYKADKDEVTPTGQEKKVDKIRLRCTQGTVKIKKITIIMVDGTQKDYKAHGSGVLTKGSVSFDWKVPNSDVNIRKVILEYDAVGNILMTKRGKIVVEGRLK